MDEPPIVATRSGVAVRDRAALAELRDVFAREHVVRLRGLLADELLARVLRSIDEGTFAIREDAGIAVELCLEPNRAFDLLMFVMNAPRMLEAMRELTGCTSITSFSGRIYRFDPAVAHHDSWHDDTQDGTRLIGISLNLGRVPFSGGEFQLRPKEEPERTITIANTGPGDAIVFRIDRTLQHRVRPAVGDVPKTALAGWFTSGDNDYWSMLR
jgi:hypothetical protein